MADNKEMMESMDFAAKRAEEELKANIAAWSVQDLLRWYRANCGKAGHKRLGRLLAALGK